MPFIWPKRGTDTTRALILFAVLNIGFHEFCTTFVRRKTFVNLILDMKNQPALDRRDCEASNFSPQNDHLNKFYYYCHPCDLIFMCKCKFRIIFEFTSNGWQVVYYKMYFCIYIAIRTNSTSFLLYCHNSLNFENIIFHDEITMFYDIMSLFSLILNKVKSLMAIISGIIFGLGPIKSYIVIEKNGFNCR